MFGKYRVTHCTDANDAPPSLPHLEIGFPADMNLVIDAVADEMHCPFALYQGNFFEMTLFHLPPPCFPTRIVVMTMEMITKDEVHLVFSGNTKPFKNGFFDLGAKLAKADSADQNYPEYYRVWRNVCLKDVTKAIGFLEKIMGTQCLDHSPVMVRINNDADSSLSNVQQCLDHVKDLPHVQIDY